MTISFWGLLLLSSPSPHILKDDGSSWHILLSPSPSIFLPLSLGEIFHSAPLSICFYLLWRLKDLANIAVIFVGAFTNLNNFPHRIAIRVWRCITELFHMIRERTVQPDCRLWTNNLRNKSIELLISRNNLIPPTKLHELLRLAFEGAIKTQ